MPCAFPDCDRTPQRWHKLCGGHQWQKYEGRPLRPLNPRRQPRLSVAEKEEVRRLANLPFLAGGTISLAKGYPSFSFHKNGKKYCFLIHRLVMEVHLGRPLLPAEVVHHGPLGKRNPSIENLHLVSSNPEHIKTCHPHRPLKTHCKRGHLLAPPNLCGRQGLRACRQCHNLEQNRRRAVYRSSQSKRVRLPHISSPS